jgi:hypothetical protein
MNIPFTINGPAHDAAFEKDRAFGGMRPVKALWRCALVWIAVALTTFAARAQERELHAIGVYQGVDGFSSGFTHLEGNVSVTVNRPTKAVTLFLSAYEPVLWKVTVAQGTTLEKVFISGYHAQRVEGVDPAVPVVILSYETGTTYILTGGTINSPEFLASVPKIHALTGLELSSFQGEYTNPTPGKFVIDRVQDDPRLRSEFPQPVPDSELPDPALASQKFTLTFRNPSADTGVVTREYTLRGPSNTSTLFPRDMRVIADETGHVYYGAEQHTVFKIDASTGVEENIPYEVVAPEGWPMGTAFDSKRGRVVVVNLSGAGALYSSVAPHTQWSLLASMDNRDVDSIDYHPGSDSYFAVATSYNSASRILTLSADSGSYLGDVELPMLPSGIGFGSYRSEITSLGDYLVVLLGPQSFFGPSNDSTDARIYLVDPRNGRSWLTYRNARTQPNQPPVVKVVSPADGATFLPGTKITIAAEATDTDGSIDKVEFFANNQDLGEGTNVGAARYEIEWTVPPSGSYSIVTRAFDKEGLDGFSAPVRVLVRANQAPNVRITSPVNDARLPAETEVTLLADATDSDGFVKNVSFFANGELIGTGESAIEGTHYRLVWKTPATGTFLLLARATDNSDAVGTSAPVRVTVGTNAPPRVRLVAPQDKVTVRAGATVPLVAEAFDSDGRIQKIEFFANGKSLGLAFPSPIARAVFQLLWKPAEEGEYALTAKATDNEGASAMSGEVHVRVVDVPVLAVRHLPRFYRPGMKFRVRIVLDPGDNTVIEAVREKPPVGWVVGRITHGGSYHAETGTIEFGPFNDGRRRILGYQVTVPDDAFNVQTFSGETVVNGVSSPIGGDKTIGLPPRLLERQISAGRPVEN